MLRRVAPTCLIALGPVFGRAKSNKPPAHNIKTINECIMAGHRLHTEWEETKVHTATCDVCNKKNSTTLHRCKKCSASFCDTCGNGINGAYRDHVLPNKTAVVDGVQYQGVVTGVVDTKRPRAAVVSRKKHPRPSRASSVVPDAPTIGSSPNGGSAAGTSSGVLSPSADRISSDRISSVNASALSGPSSIARGPPSIAGDVSSIAGNAPRSTLPPVNQVIDVAQSTPVHYSSSPEKLPSFENLIRHLREHPTQAVEVYSKMSSNGDPQLPASQPSGSTSNAAETSTASDAPDGTFGPPPLGTFQIDPYAAPNSDTAPSAHSNASASDVPMLQAYDESELHGGDTTEEENWQASSPTNNIASNMGTNLGNSGAHAHPVTPNNLEEAPTEAEAGTAQHDGTGTQGVMNGMHQV